MTKSMTRVDRRPEAVELDEEAIREAFLLGQSASTIAGRHDYGLRKAVANLISVNKQQWLDEARYGRIQPDERKIVISRRVPGRNGSQVVMPISLPRISVHVRALQEARHG